MGTFGLGTFQQDGQNFLRILPWSETLPTQPFLPSSLSWISDLHYTPEAPPACSFPPPL